MAVAVQVGYGAAEAATLAGLGSAVSAGVLMALNSSWNVGLDIGTAIYEIPAVNGFIADTIDSIFLPEPIGTVTPGPLTPSTNPFPTVGYNDDGIYYRDVPVSDPIYGGN